MNVRCSQSPLQALYRIFVLPTISIPTTSNPALPRSLQNARPFSHTSSHRADRSRKPEVRKQRWNEQITARQIYLVDESTGKLSSQPVNPRNVLLDLDLKTHRLVQITHNDPPPQQSPPQAQRFSQREDPPPIPICKIISKAAMFEATQRRREAAKAAKRSGVAKAGEEFMKTVELNWAIDSNDLAHRLSKVKGFLEEGRRVDLVLAAKRQGRKASGEECANLVSRIREMVGEVGGGAREKAGGFEGQVGKLVRWTLVGRVAGRDGGSSASTSSSRRSGDGGGGGGSGSSVAAAASSSAAGPSGNATATAAASAEQ